MRAVNDQVYRVLDCANRAAGTHLTLPECGDILLEEFGFDSLSVFAFILELENVCGINFDESLLSHERLHSIRTIAELLTAN